MWFKKEKQNTLTLIFDIGSASVGAALVYLAPNGKPSILYTVRKLLPYQSERDYRTLLKAMLETLHNAAYEVVHQGMRTVADHYPIPGRSISIVCILSSPWYVMTTRTLILEEKKPFEISPAFMEDLLKRSKAKFEKELASRDEAQQFANSVLIEERVVQTTLNGYPTNNPYGKKAKRAEIKLFLSMGSRDVIEGITSTLSRNFHTDNIALSSLATVSFTVLRDIYPSEDNFVMAHIGGEVTEIALVREDMLVDLVTFPRGRMSIVRDLVNRLGITHGEGESLLMLSSKDKLNQKKAVEALVAAKEAWLTDLERELHVLAGESTLPRALFLTTEEQSAQWFKELVSKRRLCENILGGELFHVIPITTESLPVVLEKKLSPRADAFLSLETAFISRLS